jgi:uncharacterized protein YodC (DUF2158 family)
MDGTMKADFSKGDPVQEKMSGTTMVVSEVYISDLPYRYLCSWQDSAGTLHHELFHVEQLEHFHRLTDDTKNHAALPDNTAEHRSL